MLMRTVSSVIVADLNVVGVTIGQPKADAPLVVHRDRVLAMPICADQAASTRPGMPPKNTPETTTFVSTTTLTARGEPG
jgi:hypothetical protein